MSYTMSYAYVFILRCRIRCRMLCRYTISCAMSYVTYDVRYDIVYDIVCDIPPERVMTAAYVFGQLRFKLLHRLVVNGTTRPCNGTLMMKEIMKTSSTVHRARWHTIQDLVILLPSLWRTFRTGMILTSYLWTKRCADYLSMIPAHLPQEFRFRTR